MSDLVAVSIGTPASCRPADAFVRREDVEDFVRRYMALCWPRVSGEPEVNRFDGREERYYDTTEATGGVLIVTLRDVVPWVNEPDRWPAETRR